MTTTSSRWRRLAFATAAAAASLASSGAARADEQTVKLIKLLIAKGILTQGQAGELLRETGGASPGRTRHGRPASAPATTTADTETEAPARHGDIRVTYVPQFIRRQIADQVRAQVMSEAQQEGWAAPDALPEWTRRFKLYGDIRLREEGDLFDSSNARDLVRNYDQFINFNSINNGSPFDDQNPNSLAPLLNTTEDRERLRLRARLGVKIDIDEGLKGDIRIATGQDNSPISQNQTLGSPGDFTKYGLWLDRGYLQYDPIKEATFLIGRMNNPFFTSDLLFYNELAFDGLAAQYHQYVGGGVDAFAAGGAFPVLNTAFDFSTTNTQKFRSRDAYLFAIQAGAKWHVTPDYLAELGIGLFDFNDVQGSVSKPCFPAGSLTAPSYACDTDNTRPAFLTFGNTLYRIRDIVQPAGNTGTPFDPQYYGLAARFNVLEVHPRVDILTYHPIDIAIEGDFIKNLAFNADAIVNHGPNLGLGTNGKPFGVGPVNNLGSTNNPAVPGPYQGGDTGYMAKVTLGHLQIHKLWDWNAYAAYKYLETDATLDSLTDPDFHLGGTNAQGYIIGGSLGVARDTYVGLRWYSAQAISGPHYGNDVVQLELQANF